MITRIRQFEDDDYEMVVGWWAKQDELPPSRSMLPETTWILELDGTPALCVCLYLMNCPEACKVENLVGNPDLKGPDRYQALSILFEHLEEEARDRGYSALVLFSHEPRLKDRYQELGFVKTLENVTTFSKRII